MPHSLQLSAVVASLSHALDLTEGQPAGHAIRACMIGMEIGDELRLGPRERSDLFYTLLLKDAGCSANAAPTAELFRADDQPVKRDFKTTDWARPVDTARYVVRNAAEGQGLWTRMRTVGGLALAGQRQARQLVRIRCERGAELVRELGFSDATANAIRHLDEHWDGGGHPFGARGDDIPLLARIACLAQTMEVFLDSQGPEEALEVVRTRSGTWFDPELARVVCSWGHRGAWWARVRKGGALDDLDGLEPGDRVRTVDQNGLDLVATVFARVIDAKSPYTALHSTRVAGLARALAERMGMGGHRARLLHRAGLLHDIGKLGVSNRILDKAGRLTDEEFAQVREHPRHTREILARLPAFADILEPAANHHERLDGKGYPRGLTATDLDRSCRVLAVADVYEAITARRPYRDPMSLDEVRRVLAGMAGTALDEDIVGVLLEGAAALGPDYADWGQERPADRVGALSPGGGMGSPSDPDDSERDQSVPLRL